MNMISDLREKGCVLACAATYLKDGFEVQVSKDISSHFLIEIACQIFIGIICLRPLIVCFLNVHICLCETEKFLIQYTAQEGGLGFKQVLCSQHTQSTWIIK